VSDYWIACDDFFAHACSTTTGSVSVCLSAGACDLVTSCNDVVPEILSLERSVAAAVRIKQFSELDMAPSDSLKNATDADRLLAKCVPVMGQKLPN
jgi:hypothetical protein